MHLYTILAVLTFSATVVFSSSNALAHEAPTHAHVDIAPIPSYNRPTGGASAAASLKSLKTLLDSFSTEQRDSFIFDLNSNAHSEWSNLPASFKERSGISMKDMTDTQRQLTFNFLAASLDELGYRRIAEVMAAEGVLSKADQSLIKRYGWDPENYYFAVFGKPAATGQWGWQF